MYSRTDKIKYRGNIATRLLVMDELPIIFDLLLGQDWLEKFGFNLQIPYLGINLPFIL